MIQLMTLMFAWTVPVISMIAPTTGIFSENVDEYGCVSRLYWVRGLTLTYCIIVFGLASDHSYLHLHSWVGLPSMAQFSTLAYIGRDPYCSAA